MEFVQYHPTGLPGTGILITEASRGEGGHLLNKEGERFLERYIPGKMELGPRDILSRAIMTEMNEGRAFEGEYGGYVHLDLSHLGEKMIDEKLPFVRELVVKYVGIDPVHEPIPVRPVVHYMMGGVSTDINGNTSIPGLLAAGEVACITLNGANRLGSNSLTECLVFGALSGGLGPNMPWNNSRCHRMLFVPWPIKNKSASPNNFLKKKAARSGWPPFKKRCI